MFLGRTLGGIESGGERKTALIAMRCARDREPLAALVADADDGRREESERKAERDGGGGESHFIT